MSVSIIKSTALILNQYHLKGAHSDIITSESADAALGPAGYSTVGFCIHSEVLQFPQGLYCTVIHLIYNYPCKPLIWND